MVSKNSVRGNKTWVAKLQKVSKHKREEFFLKTVKGCNQGGMINEEDPERLKMMQKTRLSLNPRRHKAVGTRNLGRGKL